MQRLATYLLIKTSNEGLSDGTIVCISSSSTATEAALEACGGSSDVFWGFIVKLVTRAARQTEVKVFRHNTASDVSHTDFSGAGYQPANHLSPSPVQRGQSHPHHLQKKKQNTHLFSSWHTDRTQQLVNCSFSHRTFKVRINHQVTVSVFPDCLRYNTTRRRG